MLLLAVVLKRTIVHTVLLQLLYDSYVLLFNTYGT